MVAKVSCLKSSPLNANSLHFPIMPQLSISLGWKLAISLCVGWRFYILQKRSQEEGKENRDGVKR